MNLIILSEKFQRDESDSKLFMFIFYLESAANKQNFSELNVIKIELRKYGKLNQSSVKRYFTFCLKNYFRAFFLVEVFRSNIAKSQFLLCNCIVARLLATGGFGGSVPQFFCVSQIFLCPEKLF